MITEQEINALDEVGN